MTSSRIHSIVNHIPKNLNVLDIGTDHAQLPILLYKLNDNIKIGCSEVAKGPFNIAKNNLDKLNLLDKISLYYSNGLKNIKDLQIYNVISICGMGGKLISEIIKDVDKRNKYLVLQPNNSPQLVRNQITKQNYKIIKEEIIYDKQKLYILIIAKKRSIFLLKYLQPNKRNYFNPKILDNFNINKFNYITQSLEFLEQIRNPTNKRVHNYLLKKYKKVIKKWKDKI